MLIYILKLKLNNKITNVYILFIFVCIKDFDYHKYYLTNDF